MSEPDSKTSSYVALIGVQLLFGSLPVVGKFVLTTVPPVGLVGTRVGVTAVVLIAIQAARRRFWLKQRSDYFRLAILSIFGVTLNQLLFIGGLSLTKASNTSLLAVTIPIFAMAIGAVSGYERLQAIKVLGIAVAAIGVLLIIDPRNASFSSDTTLGDLMIVANSLSYGIYVATSKDVVTRNGAFRSIMWLFIFASVICVPAGIVSFSNSPETISVSVWLTVIYIAVGATAAPYLLNAWALARVQPSTVAVFIYLQPLLGTLLAVAVLGESIGPIFIGAAVLIFFGLYLVTRPGRDTQT